MLQQQLVYDFLETSKRFDQVGGSDMVLEGGSERG